MEDLTGGSVEVTVWPDIYEQTRDCRQTGTSVVAACGEGPRRSRPASSRSVQNAVVYGEEPFDPSVLVQQRRTATGRTGTRYAGTGNGHQEQAPPTPTRGRVLRIVLEETDDPEGDHERLRSLVDALRDYAGEGRGAAIDTPAGRRRGGDGAAAGAPLPGADRRSRRSSAPGGRSGCDMGTRVYTE